jgi:DNA-binding beta-propeller fold protein YncE
MELQLSKTIEARTAILTDKVSYTYIIDSQEYKNVVTDITLATDERGYPITKQLVLWEGEAYDAIGQWTDEQAEQRIIELLTS